MITQIIDKLRLVKKMFGLNDIANISLDKLFCRIYIDFDSIGKRRPCREDLLKTMEKGCRILEEIGIKYWLGRGSVLGFHRDGDFLPNDSDIDIDVLADRDIYEIIRRMPFDILYVTSSGGHYMQFAFLDRETDAIFDLWFYHETDGKLMNRNHYGYFWLPADKVQNLTTIRFNGRDYPSPEPEWFCEFWYGKDWKTPKKYGKDWSIDYRRDCNGFIYRGEKKITVNNYF